MRFPFRVFFLYPYLATLGYLYLHKVMIIYAVTINIEEDAHDAWLGWMLNGHLSKVMETGCFTRYRFCKLLTRQPEEGGTTYNIQYEAKTLEDYDRYSREFAPELQGDGIRLFGSQFTAFRTVLEVLEEK